MVEHLRPDFLVVSRETVIVNSCLSGSVVDSLKWIQKLG